MKREVVISLCDKSGIMLEPWAEDGFMCIAVDLQHSISATKKGKHRTKSYIGGGVIHYVWGDTRSWKPESFDKDFFKKYTIRFISCFPVCTNLAGSGAQYWCMKGIPMLTDALMLFHACETVASWSGAPYCVENPSGCIPSHHRKPDYYFHPWYYGETYQKYTGLWTGNDFIMPEREFITKPEGVTQKIIDLPPSELRDDERSETPRLFAEAVKLANC